MNYDYFCDEAFKVAMRSVCKEYRSEYIDPAKVKEVRIEYAKSLADLEYLPNLESIHLLYAELNDVIRLKRLPRLTELIIEMCDISNIGAVWNLTGLTSLSISMSKVTKSKNATLPNNLRELFLCNISKKNLPRLSTLTRIEQLTIQRCKLDHIKFVSSMKKLQKIDVSMNHIRDISPLETLSALESVDLWDNEITDIKPLKKLRAIRRLSLSNNPIDFGKCSLNDLDCSGNITDIALYDLPVDSAAMVKFRKLKKLSIGGEHCMDISFLPELKELETFSLVKSRVKDISCLGKLPNLKSVWLEDNKAIDDYSYVYALPKNGKEVHTSGWTILEDYVELHVHTVYSEKRSVIIPSVLIEFLSEVHAKAVAVTDLNSITAYYKLAGCTQKNPKIIFGAEIRTERGNVTLLAKNQYGIENLYKIQTLLIDDPVHAIISRDIILSMRDNLLLGSCCEYGELASVISDNQDWESLIRIAREFDYLEIMPTFPEETVKTIVRLGQELNIPVCAVSDARFLYPEDESLLPKSMNTGLEHPRFLRDWHAKRAASSYMNDEKLQEVILNNPGRIASMIEDIDLRSCMNLPGILEYRSAIANKLGQLINDTII